MSGSWGFVDVASLVFLAFAVPVFLVLLRVPAPYGRHARSGWGPAVNPRAGWALMEAPAALVMPCWFLAGSGWEATTAMAFLLLWEFHYAYRAFVYPLTLPPGARRIPLIIVAFGFLFNVVNASLQGLALFAKTSPRDASWLVDPRFLVGTALFFGGLVLNRRSDATLRRLRVENDGYRIPEGGLFRYVSCPNYLGEIIEWLGWAVATWTLAGFAFAAWTAANLTPRALAHHRWYRERMADYPRDRRALIPWIL